MALTTSNSGGNSITAPIGYLRQAYADFTTQSLNNETAMLSLIEEAEDVDVAGTDLVFKVHRLRNAGVGARGEDGNLPIAGRQGLVDAKVTPKEEYGRIELTGRMMAAGRKKGPGAISNVIADEVEGCLRDLKADVDRQCFGNKLSGNTNTGILAQVNMTGAAVTTVTCNNPGTRYIKPGMGVVIGTAANIGTGAPAAASEAVSVVTVPSTTTFTIASTTVADDDLIVKGDADGTGYTWELTGMEFAAAASTTYLGIDPATYPQWDATRLSSTANRPLTPTLMDLAMRRANENENGGVLPDVALGHLSFMVEIAKLLTGDRRYVGLELRGGFKLKTLVWNNGENDVSLIEARHAPYNKLHIFPRKIWKKCTLLDWEWASADGSRLSRITNKNNYEAYCESMFDIACTHRAAHAVLSEITVDAAATQY